jgi:hypothetical protein
MIDLFLEGGVAMWFITPFGGVARQVRRFSPP